MLTGHKNAVTTSSFSDDNRFLVSCSMDNTVMVWVNSKDRFVLAKTLTNHIDFVSCLDFSMTSYRFVTGSFDKTIKICDITSLEGETIVS